MLGEKDHGKSTLIGNLLIGTGAASPERIADAREASRGKRFEPGYILDSFSEERQNEMTIDTTRAELIHKNRMYELVDVPGHLELIKNMLSGASNARTAILMVSSKFEEQFTDQSKRHVFLAAMLGIDRLIIAINKMDMVDYDKMVFDQIKTEVINYLDAIGFKGMRAFVPVSAYLNENTIKRAQKIDWYDGDSLIELLHKMSATRAAATHGLRALVQDVYGSGPKKAAFSVIYTGTVKTGEKLHAEPSGNLVTVSKIHVKGRSTRAATAGSNAAIMFKNDALPVKGEVLYGAAAHIKPIKTFNAKIFAIDSLSGKTKLTLKMNNNSMAVKKLKINKIISPIAGAAGKSTTGQVPANSAAITQITLSSEQPIEPFARCEELGRFMLYNGHKLAAIGIIE